MLLHLDFKRPPFEYNQRINYCRVCDYCELWRVVIRILHFNKREIVTILECVLPYTHIQMLLFKCYIGF